MDETLLGHRQDAGLADLRPGAVADVSVVICAFTEERWDDLAAAIASVRGQLVRPRELVVVIDHNPALAGRVTREFAGTSGLRVIESDQPRGVTGSRNAAVAATTGSVLVFLDDDAYAEPNWLMELLVPYADPAVIGVGGALEPLWATGRPAWFPDEFNWVVGCTYRGMPTQPAAVRNFIGANMSFRREAFERVGFNTAIGHVGHRAIGGSDPDFCIRAARAFPDRVLLYQPTARVHHRAHAGRARWSYFRARCYLEGLSKAMVRRDLGSTVLATERSYTMRTLPSGVLRGLSDAAAGDVHGVRRAAAIIAGLAFTATGFTVGSFQRSRSSS